MYLNIRVVTNARQNKVVLEEGGIKVYITAPPVDGKANDALIEFLSEHFKVKKRQITIVRGEKTRDKMLEINRSS